MILNNNEFINWQNAQLVTQTQLNYVTYDTYDKIAALTNDTLPCIISGGTVTISGSNIIISNGFFRCKDITGFSGLPVGTQGFFNVSSSTLPITNNYYIIAVINIASDPINPGYFFRMNGDYQIIDPSSYNPATMIILGQMNSNGTLVNFYPRSYDYNNLSSILLQQHSTPVSSNYTIQNTDNIIYTATEGITITMPLSSNLIQPKTFTIQNYSSGLITINGNGINIGANATYNLSSAGIITLFYKFPDNIWLLSSNGNPYSSIQNPNFDTFSINNSSGSGLQANNNTRPGYLGTPTTILPTSFTSFGEFSTSSIASNPGFIKIPSDNASLPTIIYYSDQLFSADFSGAVSFLVPFPNNCFYVNATFGTLNYDNGAWNILSTIINKNTFQLIVSTTLNIGILRTINVYAIGN